MDLLWKVMYLKLDFHKSVNSSTISDADYTTDTSLFSQKIIWQKKKKKKTERERKTDNQGLSYFQGQLWPEAQWKFVKSQEILFKKIRDTKGTFHAKMGSINNRNGMDLTEAEDIKKRWQEHTEELYKKNFMIKIITMVWSLT